MPTYIVSYDLRTPGQKYEDLIEYLKSLSNWWHHLGSTWVVVTAMTAAQLRDGIAAHLDLNDKLLVVRSGGEGAWQGFSDSGSSWLRTNL